jgi:FHA domain/von Willebrand factor type A domain/Bacterial Ig domain
MTIVTPYRQLRSGRRSFLRSLFVLLISIPLLLGSLQKVSAQGAITNLLVLGMESGASPDYTLRASILSPDGAGVPDLTPDAFALMASDGSPIPVTAVQPVNGGVAAMIVADLGGLNQPSPRGVLYQQEVESAVRQFVQTLQKGSPNQEDFAGLIVTTGTGAGKFAVVVTPTTDLGLVNNSLEPIKSAKVEPTTALYDGLNEALDLLGATPGLEQKRKVILLFSDGADQKFSGDAILGNIPVRAREGKVTIFCLQARKRTDVETKNMTVLATQSGGGYALIDGAPQQISPAINGMYSVIDSQRLQYALAFRVIRPLGDYTAKLTTKTPAGDFTQELQFTSNLKAPTVRLTAPDVGTRYIQTGTLAMKPITLTAEVTFPDSKTRAVSIEFRADGKRVGEVAQPPYAFVWRPAPEIQSETTQTLPHTLSAVVKDSWLTDWQIESKGVDVSVQVAIKPTPTPAPIGVAVTKTAQQEYPLVAALCGLGVLVVILAIVLVLTNRRMREQMRQIQADARKQGGVVNMVRTATRRLSAGTQAIAELEVVQGATKGQRLIIDSDTCWIGRDSAQCQVPINDDAASGKHCQIIHEPSGQFYVLDEHSTNGTFVNQSLIPKNTRIPIQPGAMIQIGRTILALRVGRGTQRLERTTQRVGL